ncbi:LacI family transcriptional regulator [Jannaschia pagri]|uniref:LacI family transcriptional regulator n=1 Tax=Jannaschia pagri TaxID=2829797 RepID=A0ABQ4NIS8_9RHOB|nr:MULTISPECIES: LacI family DNA-binding transcriptional regulator [unclassified Jannaschia]GIT89600.1 LacI family transcriptional regulator [Jannaschia sp. AI_61]GIT94292.1 LacI family transcriptional regulator [Jannaschia sp. AI_62]
MERRPNIADVARLAGVSTATVSRTLSTPERVGAPTRARVLEAVAASGYRANAAARDLRQRRARAITLLAPNLANTFFSSIIAAVQEVADTAGLTVQISDSQVEGMRLAGLGADGRTDGILLLDGQLDPAMVKGWSVPIVMVCEWMPDATLPSVSTDNVAGARLAVDHLLDLGHLRIACLGGPEGNVLSAARAEGWRAALSARGVSPRPQDLIAGDFTMARGVAAAWDWAAQTDRATAVFCTSDESALGFISECDRLGISVPRDVSVVGFDDIEFSDRFIPPLTTVHQPRRQMGLLAAKQLVSALTEARPLDVAAEVLPSRLVVRASTTSPL